jgi:hypothetical protein
MSSLHGDMRKTHDTTKGPLEVRIYDNNNSVFYDLIELQDETEEAIRVHMITAALRAGAPIGDGDEFKDIAKDKKKIVKAYQELQVYFTGFNQQMYSATIEAEPTAFQEANVNYDIELKNPYLGIILWLLITKGASTNKTGKRIDDMRRRLGNAACTATVLLKKRLAADTRGRVGTGKSVHTSTTVVCLSSDWCVHPASQPGVPSDECVL